ncbi:MAG TPA: YggS family pyridoxal phosphate-dependent enzyme [Thermoleophilia bacterium]|nr:YggS family pyridoxal phosphate-dependent enzyme [Thermoleophilia bacterium]
MVTQYIPEVERVRERLAEVEGRVADAARAAGRDPGDVRVLVATKYVPAEHLGALHEAGVRLIGENRAQDLVAKHELHGEAFDWHFIGHLQSRKTRLVLPLVSLIHSVGSLSVVSEIEKRAAHVTDVLLEVNIGGEASKSGVALTEVDGFLEAAAAYPKVRFTGLMCMPPLFDDAEDARPFFSRTRELAERLSTTWSGTYTFEQLSMGTSADYEVAVREGATIIRVGSVLF